MLIDGGNSLIDRKLGNQQNGYVKTTLELPSSLVREIKLRALNDGRKLKDTMADLLKKGLRSGQPTTHSRPSRVKLPLVKCRHSAELTPVQVATILLQQETEWYHEAAGH